MTKNLDKLEENETGNEEKSDAGEVVISEQSDTGGDSELYHVKIKQLSDELKKAIKENEKFKEAEKKRKEAELTELQKAQARVKEFESEKIKLETILTRFKKERAIIDALQKRGAASRATVICKLIDFDSIEIDEDGVQGVDESIESVKEVAPELFAKKATATYETALQSNFDKDSARKLSQNESIDEPYAKKHNKQTTNVNNKMFGAVITD